MGTMLSSGYCSLSSMWKLLIEGHTFGNSGAKEERHEKCLLVCPAPNGTSFQIHMIFFSAQKGPWPSWCRGSRLEGQ